jgi:hypothetical protein
MDAILCFSAIHHGLYREIVLAIQEFLRVLRPGGFLFLDILSRKDSTYGLGKALEPHTFVGGRSGEEDIPHHYVSQMDIKRILSAFTLRSIEEVCYEFELYQQEPVTSILFDIVANKPHE